MKKLLYLLLLVSGVAFSQIQVIHFNAGWNAANDVPWVEELTECKLKYIDIAADAQAAKDYKIVVVPTIVVFNEGEEVKRFQADISFSIKATKEDMQEVIDAQLMSDF